MTDTVTIPRAEYERLCAAEEDLADLQAALAVQARIDAGAEELVPWFGRRLVTGRRDGGHMSSDGGGLLLREVDARETGTRKATSMS